MSDPQTPREPEALKEALRELHKVCVAVPPGVDEAITRAARSQLATPAWAWQKWAAGAACLALGLWLALAPTQRPQADIVASKNEPAAKPPEFATDDHNRDGRVDILDALLLAQRKDEPGAKALAERVVKLKGDGS